MSDIQECNMIEKIKKSINENKGSKVKLIVNNLRNKCEKHEGTITETYNYVFIVRTNENVLKSFSYSDVLTQNIELFFD